MSDFEFTLSKPKLAALVACLAISGVALFSAGMVTGLIVRKPSVEALPVQAAAPASVRPAPKSPAPEPEEEPAKPAPSVASAKPDSAGKPGVEPKPDPQPGLLVQVASFRNKGRADHLADALKRQGFEAVSVASAVDQETWHVVRIGPYRDWDVASQVAAEIDKAYAVRTRVLASTATLAN